ncbi:MAG: FkbM family methyltransferase [Solirubrobacteraceae bacterium]
MVAKLRAVATGTVVFDARRAAKQIARKLGLYEHIVVARERRNPALGRNDRDNRHLAAMLAAILRPDSSAIDIGANVGDVLGTIVRLAPHGHHIAFEPIPALAERLARAYPSVDVHASAASDHGGTATFQWIEALPATSGLRLRADNTREPTAIEVPLERLDDVVEVAPAFLKIDVEGGEEAVLRGAQETLERHRPVVAFEHGTPAAAAFGTTPDVIYELLAAPGLRVFDMDGEGPLSRDEFVEVVRLGDQFNFIAC